MNLDLVRRLVLYLVDQLQDRELPISTIRLIKLLYLIDLEYYNRHGETLTGIEWVKYKYGPYFFQWPTVVQKAGVDLEVAEVQTERGPGRTYRVYPQPADVLPLATRALAADVLSKRADDDLDELLEHVYETLPVKYGEHDKPLDFTLETDHLVLEEAKRTATDFLTFEEFTALIGETDGSERAEQ